MNTLEEQIKISRNVIIEMLEDRGYTIEHIVSHIPQKIFLKMWESFMNDNNDTIGAPVFDFECENDTGDRIYIKYIREHIKKKTKKNTTYINFKKLHEKVKHMNDILFNDQILYVICDTDNENIEENNKIINIRMNKNVEVFDIKRLMTNITKHAIVPTHEKISIAKVHQLKKTLRIKNIYKLPAILKYDPVARYFNFKQGDVIKITRNSKSTGIHISYRVCIEHEDIV